MDDKIKSTIEKIRLLAQQNPDFDQEMRKMFGGTSTASNFISKTINNQIDEIYEYCIARILKEQAEQFYMDFPIIELKQPLIDDYIRMEHFRRHSEFGDFCLSAFQQIENIVNWFCHRKKFIDTYEQRFNESCVWEDMQGKSYETLGRLFNLSHFEENINKKISDPSFFFNNRLRAVIYFVSLGDNPNKYQFDTMYNQINELYICRNLNHRGGQLSSKQEGIINGILPHKYQYYLKFTGVLVNFVDSINQFMAKKEIKATIKDIIGSLVTVELEDGNKEIFTPTNHRKIYYKLNKLSPETKLILTYHMNTHEYFDVITQ